MMKLVGAAQAKKALMAIATSGMINKTSMVNGVARKVKTDMRSFAPKDKRNLEQSIDIEEVESNDFSHIVKIGPSDDLEPKTSQGKPYPVLQEFGTSRFAAHPFVRPARDKNVDELESAAKTLF